MSWTRQPHQRAVIFIDYDLPHPDKQETLTLRRAQTLRLVVVGLCSRAESCAALIESGAAEVVVTAAEDGKLADLVEAAGGRVEVVRPLTRRARRDVLGVLRRMAQRGMDTGEIAYILDMDTGEVRRVKARLRMPPRPRRGNGGGAG